MLIDLKKYFSGEDISQAIDYTVDLSEVEIDGCKPFVTPVQVKGSIRSFASSAGAERGGALCVFDAVQQVLDVDA